MQHYEEHGRPLVELGYDITPVKVRDKKAFLPKWQERPEGAKDYARHGDASVGVVAGGDHNLIGLDIDVLDAVAASYLKSLAFDHLGAAPVRIGLAPKCLLVYRCSVPVRKIKTGVYDINGAGDRNAVEVLAEGQQFVAHGIHPDTQQPYTWPGDSLTDYEVSELTVVSAESLGRFREEAEAVLTKYGTLAAASHNGGTRTKPPAMGGVFQFREHSLQARTEEIAAALEHIPNPDVHYDDWVRLALAVKGSQKGMSEDGGKALFFAWSQKSTKHDDAETKKMWASIEPNNIGAGTVFDWAKKDGFDIGTWRANEAPSPETVSSGLVLDPANPMATARVIIGREHTHNGLPTLHHYSGDFRQWKGNHYPAADGDAIKAAVYRVLENAERPNKDGPLPFQPTTTKVANVLDALKAATNLDKSTLAPTWLDGSTNPDPKQVLAMKNGLLDLGDRQLMTPSPLFWTHNALDYAYEPNAGGCHEWERFLTSIWGDDPVSIEVLQELFGYLLTSDTRQQKAFLLVGPKRSGKGTIARVLMALLGAENVCAPTLASLSSQFGLSPLIDKLVAVIADARLGSRADQHQIAERLLSVSGEDGQTIDRKYLTPWYGRLPTRFVIMSNELPRLADASGALASRFIILRMTKSFYGHEDQGLTERILGELPAVLNWALDGRDRLAERGHFQQPQSSLDAIEELEDLSSPIGAFVRDRLEVGPLFEDTVDAVYSAWKDWCEEQGRNHPGTRQTFGRDLRAAVPSLQTGQRRTGTSVIRYYRGIFVV